MKDTNTAALDRIHAECDTSQGLTAHGAYIAGIIRHTQRGHCICDDLDMVQADGFDIFGAECEAHTNDEFTIQWTEQNGAHERRVRSTSTDPKSLGDLIHELIKAGCTDIQIDPN